MIKKIFLVPVLVSLVIIGMASCVLPTNASNDPAFVGTWKTTATTSLYSQVMTTVLTSTTFESTSVNTYSTYSSTSKVKGTLTYSGSTITTTMMYTDNGSGYVAYTGPYPTSTATWGVSGTTLTITPSTGSPVIYTKQ